MAFLLARVRVLARSSALARSVAPVRAGQASSRAAAPRRPAPAAAACRSTRRAWLYKGSDITPDPAWQFGTLPNGLRYAVRRTACRRGRSRSACAIDAGSLYETDSERGFAHFIEHLSFRGSNYVPDGEAKRVWQRFGATFGSDTNASDHADADRLQARPALGDRGDGSTRASRSCRA